VVDTDSGPKALPGPFSFPASRIGTIRLAGAFVLRGSLWGDEVRQQTDTVCRLPGGTRVRGYHGVHRP
jgi:hypothetical protein